MAISDSQETQALAFQIHPSDNVATLLRQAGPGFVAVRGGAEVRSVNLEEPVELGHKVAVEAIGVGEPVLKFGVVIGVASQAIAAGEWVHLHNCRSRLDERSGTLDLHTGLPEDTKYV